MPIGWNFQCVPRHKHGAGLFLSVEAQQNIRKAKDGARRLATSPQDCFGQRVIRTIGE